MTADDSRWERWTGSSQIYLLQSWAHRNIDRLFTFIHSVETKTTFDVDTMSNKLMSFASSFGRMGLDFRSLIVHEFTQLVVDGFKKTVGEAVKSLISVQKLDLVDSDIFESTLSDLGDISIQDSEVLSAPLELCIWDDICVFGNKILEAFNETRHSLSISYINKMFSILKLSLQDVFKWIDSFLPKNENLESIAEPFDETIVLIVRKAAKILMQYFVPFISKCFTHCFSYEKCCRSLVRSHFTIKDFNKSYTLLSEDLFVYCKHDIFFKKILQELNNAVITSLSEISKSIQNEEEAIQFKTSKNNISDSVNEVADQIEELLNQEDDHLKDEEMIQQNKNVNVDEVKNSEIIQACDLDENKIS